MEKQAVIAVLVKLKCHQRILEKSQYGFLSDRRLEIISNFKDLLSLEDEFTQQRLMLLEEQSNMLWSVADSVKAVKNKIERDKKSMDFNVKEYKDHLSILETDIAGFKARNHKDFVQMSKDCEVLSDELSLITNRVEACERRGSVVKKVVSVTRMKETGSDIIESRPKEIVEFEEFLRNTGGHTGGWNEEDHSMFVHVWEKSQERHWKTFMSLMYDTFPFFTEDEIQKHCSWYPQYMNLKDKFREALKEWKESRLSTKLQETVKEEKASNEKALQEARKKEEDMQEWEYVRAQKAEHLTRWKKLREMRLEMKEIEEERREEENRFKVEERRKKMEHKKNVLEKFLLEKAEAKHAVQSRIEQTQTRSSKELKKCLQASWLRDREIALARRQSLRRSVSDGEEIIIARRPSHHLNSERNPERVLQMTKSTVARYSKKPAEQIKGRVRAPVNFIKNIPSRTIPDWRKPALTMSHT